MKLHLLILSIVSVLTVDGLGQPGHDSNEGNQGKYSSYEIEMLEDESVSNIGPQEQVIKEQRKRSDSTFRDSRCKAKGRCAILGGSCISNSTQCMGKLMADGCRGENCSCCIPGCPAGFFFLPASQQCFKYYNDKGRSWEASKMKCQEDGLQLARPYNVLELKSYFIQKYGSISYVWLNGRGDGNYIRWQDDKMAITTSNPLWYSGHPGSMISSSYCLMIYPTESYWKSQPDKAYYAHTCSHGHHAICELIME